MNQVFTQLFTNSLAVNLTTISCIIYILFKRSKKRRDDLRKKE